MNLMFWKKKPEIGNDAEDAQRDSSMNKKERESLDFAAVKQDSTGSNPESPKQGAVVKTGLVARLKSKSTSFTRHFRKAPAFQAGEDYASDFNDSSKSAPDNTPAMKSGSKQSDTETPARPGLVAQIKSQFAALVLRFKKVPTPDAEEDQDKGTRRRSKDESKETEETPEKLGLVERVKSNLSAFITLHKKLLIITLLLLSLIGIVYAAWDIIFPPLERKHGTDKTPTHEPAPPEQSQIESEALKKKSEEEQMHTEAPKKDSPEQTQAEAEALKEKNSEVQAHTEAPKKDSPEQTQAGAKVLMKKSEEVSARAEAPKKNGSEQAQAEAEALKSKSEDAQALAEALKKESEDTQAQAETLKKQSEAAQARAEELKKKEEEKARAEALKKSSRQQPPLDSSARHAGGGAAPSPSTGEVTVGSKDPKAAAQSLKEAIEAMNVGSGGASKKSVK